MSTLKTNTIQAATGSTLSIATGTTLSGAAGAITAPGQVIGYKTQQASNSTQISGTTYADITNMTLDYACKVASSLVYVIVHVQIFIPQQATAWQTAGIKILRGSTALYTDVGYGSGHYTDSSNDRFMHFISVTTATSPGDTSSQTYKVQGAKLRGTSYADFNNASYGAGGRITVMEIAQ